MGTSRLTSSLLLLALVACTKDKPKQEYVADSTGGPAAPRPEALMSSAARTNVASLSAAAASYSADTSLYKVVYTLTKPLRTNDTVRVRLIRDSLPGYPRLLLNAWRFKQKDSVNFKVNKVFGAQANYQSCARVQNGAYQPNYVCKSWTTNLPAKPDTTPPQVDTLMVDSALALIMRPKLDTFPNVADWHAKGVYYGAAPLPNSGVPSDTTNGTLRDQFGQVLPFTCPSGGSKCPQVQFCTFVQFRDSAIAMRAIDAALPACQNEYTKLPLALRNKVKPSQQAAADRMCIQYKVVPNQPVKFPPTITSETCGVPS